MNPTDQSYQRLQKQLLSGLAGLAGVFLIGIAWYTLVERWSLTEAAYMTTITLSTVGFGETRPLGDRARLFTIALILLGILSIGYIANRFTEALIQGYFQEGMRKRQQQRLIDALDNHYILCGFGRTGRQIALEFDAEDIPFIVIDAEAESIATAQQLDYPALQGDATLDESLTLAGINRAVCIVVALRSDAENLYTVLSAKTLNPRIRAIVRANTEEAIQKLKRAGADAVVSPYITGGRRLAAAALRPQVMDFVDGIITGTNRSFYLDEFFLARNICPLIDKTLSEANLRANSGALVLAIRRLDGTLIGGPTGDTQLRDGDLLICMGTAEQLHRLNQLLGTIHAYWSRAGRQR